MKAALIVLDEKEPNLSPPFPPQRWYRSFRRFYELPRIHDSNSYGQDPTSSFVPFLSDILVVVGFAGELTVIERDEIPKI